MCLKYLSLEIIVYNVWPKLIPFGPLKLGCVRNVLPPNFSHYTEVYIKQNKIVYWIIKVIPHICIVHCFCA